MRQTPTRRNDRGGERVCVCARAHRYGRDRHNDTEDELAYPPYCFWKKNSFCTKVAQLAIRMDYVIRDVFGPGSGGEMMMDGKNHTYKPLSSPADLVVIVMCKDLLRTQSVCLTDEYFPSHNTTATWPRITLFVKTAVPVFNAHSVTLYAATCFTVPLYRTACRPSIAHTHTPPPSRVEAIDVLPLRMRKVLGALVTHGNVREDGEREWGCISSALQQARN